MSLTSVKEFNKFWWQEVYNRIIGAVVFLDDCSAECLHWDGGLCNLLNEGAVAVKSLSPFEFANKDQKKAVFLTQATSTQLKTISEIIRNSDFTHCILISSMHWDVVYTDAIFNDYPDFIASIKSSADVIRLMEAILSHWIGKTQSVVEAVHIPIFTICPTNTVFLTPPCHNLYPLFKGKLITDSPTIDLRTLNKQETWLIRRLSSGLESLLESLNMKEDIYYMGAYSSLVANTLLNFPTSCDRRRSCTNPVSLIIVDRTLDLVGVTSHSMESVLDKIMSALPRFPGHSTDVAVDMSPLCEAEVISHPDDVQLSPGCLCHANDDSCMQTLDYMINKSQKEVMFDLYNKLSKIDVQRSPSPKTLVKVTTYSVEKIIVASKGNYNVIGNNLGILQQALAVVQMLKSPRRSAMDLLMGLERQVLDNLAASGDSTSVINQISHLIKTRKDRNLPIENLLALIIHVYSLTGVEVVFNSKHEDRLAETLSVAIYEDRKTLFVNDETKSQTLTPEQSIALSKKLMARFKDIAQMRRIFQKYYSVIKPCETGYGHEYRGFLQQLMDDLVNTEKPDLIDLRYRNESLKDLLRTGLNILKNKKGRGSKHPFDNPTVILFVVGGLTAEECKQLHRRVITSGVDTTVLIGSNRLVTPVEAMRDVLCL